jgi:hypothetical protein
MIKTRAQAQVTKIDVIEEVGGFDESGPRHQWADSGSDLSYEEWRAEHGWGERNRYMPRESEPEPAPKFVQSEPTPEFRGGQDRARMSRVINLLWRPKIHNVSAIRLILISERSGEPAEVGTPCLRPGSEVSRVRRP